MSRFLFGPAHDPALSDRFLAAPIADGRWAAFGSDIPSWDTARARLSGTATPEAVLVWLGYTSVPEWVWAAPVPVVALAPDPNLLWHAQRALARLADVVLTDAPSAGRFRRAGVGHVRAANLFGLDRHFLAEIDTPEAERDIDVLFVSNTNPVVQADRLPWLARLARLGDRHRVVIASGVFGTGYRALLRRARLVFNRSIRGECNLRALEAAASGAVLLQEAGNAEVSGYLAPGTEYAPYTDDDFEAVVERLLADEPARRAVADAARDRARGQGFDALVEAAVGVGGEEWDEVQARARRRVQDPPQVSRTARVWQRVSNIGPDADPGLGDNLAAAGERHAIGVLARTPAGAEPHFAAAAGGNRVSAVAHAAVLIELGKTEEAVAELRRAVAAFEATPELTAAEADSVPYPARFDAVRVGWERAGYDRPDDPAGERREKARLLRGRVLELLAGATGAVADWEAAAAYGPELPHVRAALGHALLRAGRAAEAVTHLRFACDRNPLDSAGADALLDALLASGRPDEAERVRADRRLLAMAAPGLVPEPAPAAAVADPVEVPDLAAPHPFPPLVVDPVPAPAPPAPQPTAPPLAHRPTRFVDVSPASFARRFGTPDTRAALCGFTPPADTHVVLTLLLYVRPRRVLEIGTAAGHMTANLTAYTPEDAVVHTLGAVDRPPLPV